MDSLGPADSRLPPPPAARSATAAAVTARQLETAVHPVTARQPGTAGHLRMPVTRARAEGVPREPGAPARVAVAMSAAPEARRRAEQVSPAERGRQAGRVDWAGQRQAERVHRAGQRRAGRPRAALPARAARRPQVHAPTAKRPPDAAPAGSLRAFAARAPENAAAHTRSPPVSKRRDVEAGGLMDCPSAVPTDGPSRSAARF